MNILVVSSPSVENPMAQATARLRAAGLSVRSSDAAAFNAARSDEPDIDILFVSNAVQCDATHLRRFPRLAGVVFIASGTESVDMEAATARGVVVAHSHSEENAESMAEATVLLMLAVLYDLDRAERILRERREKPAAFSRMLKGRVVGLVGYGKIARGVMTRLQGWDVRFLVATRSPAAVEDRAQVVDLDALMERSDVVSLHAGLNEQSRGMIGERQLRLMRPGSVLINTGRGGLVDEDALARCAIERELWLGLDTFVHEPLPAESPLRTLPRAILTPHLVGQTVEGAESIVRMAVANIERIAAGQAPLHSRNWHRLGRSGG